MNKDAIIATIIGFSIGLVVTAVILFGPKFKISDKLAKFTFTMPNFALFTQNKQKSSTPKANTVAINAANDKTLIIDSPLAESIADNSEILVSGTTAPGATILLESPAGETVTIAEANGKYAAKIDLIEGVNDLIVTSYASGKPTSITLPVFYTQESL